MAGAVNTYTITPSTSGVAACSDQYTISVSVPPAAGMTVLLLNGNSLIPGLSSNCAPANTYEMELAFVAPGTYSFTVQAQDTTTQAIGARTYTFVVTDFSGTLTNTLQPASVGVAYSQQLYALGGSNVLWSLAAGSALPPGSPAFAISPAGLLTGKPTQAALTHSPQRIVMPAGQPVLRSPWWYLPSP